MFCFLQNKSYFSAHFHGYSTHGAMYYLRVFKDSSLAFRYDSTSGKVMLDDYDNRLPHTTESFLFAIVPIQGVKFLDDSKNPK